MLTWKFFKQMLCSCNFENIIEVIIDIFLFDSIFRINSYRFLLVMSKGKYIKGKTIVKV